MNTNTASFWFAHSLYTLAPGWERGVYEGRHDLEIVPPVHSEVLRAAARQASDQAALQFAASDFVLYRVIGPSYCPQRGELPSDTDTDSALEPSENHWIEVRVVRDASNEPVSGVDLRLQIPDGDARRLSTRRDGTSMVRGLADGSCSVGGPRPPGRTPLAELWHVVGIGDSPIEPELDTAETPNTGGEVGLLIQHRVADGETLEDIAHANDLDLDALTSFNWGTTDPTEVQAYLAQDLGCTRHDERGYLLSSDDEPGILYIPKLLTLDNLGVNSKHTIRVRKVLRPQLRDWHFSL